MWYDDPLPHTVTLVVYLEKVNCFVDAWKYGERGETWDSLLMFPPEIFYTVNTVPLCLFS